jgi:hypothetical protein
MSPADAVAYGVEALGSASARGSALANVARSVAAAFAQSATLDDVIPLGDVLATSDIFSELKAFIAQEVRRISSQRGVKGSELCDVSERSLREWAKGGIERQSSSAARRETSETGRIRR